MSTDWKEFKNTLDDIGSAVEVQATRTYARLDKIDAKLDDHAARIEDVEAGRTASIKLSGNRAAGADYRSFPTAAGVVYEIPAHTKLADVSGLRAAKAPEISLDRWLGAAVAGERSGDKLALEFAREQKAMTTATTGIVIPAEYQAEWVDLIRAQSVLIAAGMSTTTMTAKTQVSSAVASDPVAGWHSEAASISAANPTFASRTLTATTLVTRCQGSIEVAQDSPDFGRQLANVMTKAMAAEVDRVGLEGTGTPPQPRGIKNTSGRLSVTSVSTLTSFSKIITGLGLLLSSNADLEQIRKFAVMSPGAWTAFENLVTGISSDKSQLARPKSIEDMRFLVTSGVAGSLTPSPAVNTTIYLGDFRDLLFGTRLESSVEVVKAAGYTDSLVLDFVGYLRCDFVVRRPASFCTLEGVAA